jgi:hypothetical protein
MLDRGLSKGGGSADSVRHSVQAQQTGLRKQGCGGNGRSGRSGRRNALSQPAWRSRGGKRCRVTCATLSKPSLNLSLGQATRPPNLRVRLLGRLALRQATSPRGVPVASVAGDQAKPPTELENISRVAVGVLIGMMGAAQLMLWFDIPARMAEVRIDLEGRVLTLPGIASSRQPKQQPCWQHYLSSPAWLRWPLLPSVLMRSAVGCRANYGRFYGFAAIGGVLLLIAITTFIAAITKVNSWRDENARWKRDHANSGQRQVRRR